MLQPSRRLRRKTNEQDEQKKKKKKKGKAIVEDDDSINDLTLNEAERTILHHFGYKRVDDVHSHIDGICDEFNVIERTGRYSKWKKYEYRRKVIKVATKLKEG